MEDKNVTIKIDSVSLEGILCIPPNPIGIIIFTHSTSSSRFSPNNIYVSRVFNSAGFATLLIDLLTPQEERLDSITGEFRLNLNFLSNRINSTTKWIMEYPLLSNIPIGYYGASTGGAAAILSSYTQNLPIFGIVTRGGRLDLVGSALKSIATPTLIIVGSEDQEMYCLNQQMGSSQELIVLPNVSHEPTCIEQVAEFSKQFLKNQFEIYLSKPQQSSSSSPSSSLNSSSIMNSNSSNNFNLIGKSIFLQSSTNSNSQNIGVASQ